MMSLLSHIVEKNVSHLLLRKFVSQNYIQQTVRQHQQQYNLMLNHRNFTRLIKTSASRKPSCSTTPTINNNTTATTASSSSSPSITMTEKSFLPKRALVLRKFSRLDYEKLCHPNLTEEQLASLVSNLIISIITHIQLPMPGKSLISSLLLNNS